MFKSFGRNNGSEEIRCQIHKRHSLNLFRKYTTTTVAAAAAIYRKISRKMAKKIDVFIKKKNDDVIRLRITS